MKYEVYFIHLPMKMETTVSFETSAIRTQTPGNNPKRNKLHEVMIHSNIQKYLHNGLSDGFAKQLRKATIIFVMYHTY